MAELAAAGDAAPSPSPDVIGTSSDVSDRRRQLNERLDERHRERLQTQAQRRHERAASVVESERADYFWASLDAEESAALAGLAVLEGADRATVGDALDAASRRLQAIHHFIADAAAFLPAYELRRAQQRAKRLQESIQRRQDELVPRQRFGFRGKRAAQGEPQPEVEVAVAELVSVSAASAAAAEECGFQGLRNERLRLSGAAVAGRDVTLSRLTGCRVLVTGAPATVHLSQLRSCRLLLGPVATSVFLEDCHDCTVVAACQQLRAHTSRRCDVYLHVTSRAVIEHCEQLRFAPYNLTGALVESDWAATGLSRSANSWDDVDDFNWLSRAQRSPHWSVLPEPKRIASWDDDVHEDDRQHD